MNRILKDEELYARWCKHAGPRPKYPAWAELSERERQAWFMLAEDARRGVDLTPHYAGAVIHGLLEETARSLAPPIDFSEARAAVIERAPSPR